MKLTGWFVCSFIFLTACTVGPNYQKPLLHVPSTYSSIHRPQTKTNLTLRLFHDKQLMNLINNALAGRNFDLQASYAKIMEARAALRMTQADYFPQINASGKISRDHLSANSEMLSSIPFPIKQNYRDYRFGFDASWELDIFGHNRRMVEAGNQRLASMLANQRNLSIIIAAEIARTYIDYRTLQQRILLAQNNIKLYRQTQKLIKLLVESGEKNSIDIDRIQSELLSAKSNLLSLQAQKQVTLNALAILVGRFPNEISVPLQAVKNIPSINKKIYVGVPSDLLQRRPDIEMAEHQLAESTANVGVATANLFPRFKLVGNIGNDTVVPGTFFQMASRFWSWGPQISLPIFEAGKLQAEVAQSYARQSLALINYKKSILSAFADVESCLIRYDIERARARNLKQSFAHVKGASRLTKIEYKSGAISLDELLDVERQVNKQGDEYLQSKGQVAINLVALYKSLGGDWVS